MERPVPASDLLAIFNLRCTENGTWMQHPDFPESKKPWTNYTSCVDVEDLSVSILFYSLHSHHTERTHEVSINYLIRYSM